MKGPLLFELYISGAGFRVFLPKEVAVREAEVCLRGIKLIGGKIFLQTSENLTRVRVFAFIEENHACRVEYRGVLGCRQIFLFNAFAGNTYGF